MRASAANMQRVRDELTPFLLQHWQTVERIDNWANWSADRKRGAALCRSIEGRYIRESNLYKEVAPITMVDVRDALLVNQALGNITPAEKAHRLALHVWFIARMAPDAGCAYFRKQGIPLPVERLAITIKDAVLWTRNRVERIERRKVGAQA